MGATLPHCQSRGWLGGVEGVDRAQLPGEGCSFFPVDLNANRQKEVLIKAFQSTLEPQSGLMIVRYSILCDKYSCVLNPTS